MNKIKAVFFDFGGVLYRSPDMDRWLRWLRLFGVRDMDMLTMMMSSPRESQQVNDIWTGKTPEQEVWDRLAKSWRMHPRVMAFLRKRGYNPRQLDPVIMAYLKSLRPHYRTAILTNAASDFRKTFALALSLEGAVDQVIISAEEGLCKPDPQIYHLAAQRLEVRPGEAVFVDDRVENVEGAREAGMTAFLFTSSEETISKVQEALKE